MPAINKHRRSIPPVVALPNDRSIEDFVGGAAPRSPGTTQFKDSPRQPLTMRRWLTLPMPQPPWVLLRAASSSMVTTGSIVMCNWRILFRRQPRVMPRILAARDWLPLVCRSTRVNSIRSSKVTESAYRALAAVSQLRVDEVFERRAPLSARCRDGCRGIRLLHLVRQEIGNQHGTRGPQNRLPQHALQLPHIARPRIPPQNLHGVGRDVADRLAQLQAAMREVMPHQQRNVLPALPQRRQVDGESIQPIVQRSARNWPSATIWSKSRWVAAIIRTSV